VIDVPPLNCVGATPCVGTEGAGLLTVDTISDLLAWADVFASVIAIGMLVLVFVAGFIFGRKASS